MTREIKFRCWDIENKQMFFGGYNKWSDSKVETHDYLKLSLDGNIYRQRAYGDDCHDLGDYETEATNHYVLMQFTGLHDKNGKEIYEGDIVKSENGRVWVVKFGEFISTTPFGDEECFGYYIQPIEEEYRKKGNGYLYGGVEIISNIYENPELLTPTDKEVFIDG